MYYKYTAGLLAANYRYGLHLSRAPHHSILLEVSLQHKVSTGAYLPPLNRHGSGPPAVTIGLGFISFVHIHVIKPRKVVRSSLSHLHLCIRITLR